ncbi:hypothetical protein [Azospirillum brasilense]|uniref:hypothetical protein n=1 Tax=Azospirillum brasilense TaxID=192 RepID=UPI0003A4E476|nr:hypothetical protein [Azospirillum brasilense]
MRPDTGEAEHPNSKGEIGHGRDGANGVHVDGDSGGARAHRDDRGGGFRLDDNQDGSVSMTEFKNNQMLVFYILDRNKDLALTVGETHLPADVFASIAGNDGKQDRHS